MKWTLVEDKMRRFKGDRSHFSFSKCAIYTHDGASASAKFSTYSYETVYFFENTFMEKLMRSVDSEPAGGEGEPDNFPGRVREQDPGPGEETEGARGYYKVNIVCVPNFSGKFFVDFHINVQKIS